ncbi:MAG: DUF2834 domain-containing protein [Bacteroidia bacterium]|nr:DUF2834 domain-containing protein [Bacteroidia bacterium]
MKSSKKYLFLLLSLAGICLTYYYNIQFSLTSPDSSLLEFIALTQTTLPAKSISVDILVVCLTFFAWYIPEAIRLKMKHWWIFIPLTLLGALACAFPLFLFFRERKLEKLAKESLD